MIERRNKASITVMERKERSKVATARTVKAKY
jgi:hypothetical protein